MLIRAAALRSLGEIDAAKEQALKLKQMSTPVRAMASVILSQCYYLEGNAEEASNEILVAVRLAQNTQFVEPLVVAALLNLADGKVDAGRENLQKAIRKTRSKAYAPALLALVDCIRDTDKSIPKSVKEFIREQKKRAAGNTDLLMEMETQIYAHQSNFADATIVAKQLFNEAPNSTRKRYELLVDACEKKRLQFSWPDYAKSHWLLPTTP